MDHRPIIERLGGISALARELQHRNPSTVQGWWERRIIPARQQPSVIDVGRRVGKPITADDLIFGTAPIAAGA